MIANDDEIVELGPDDEPPAKKNEQFKLNRRKAATVRKHRVENVNRNQLAQTLDAYAAEGRTILALNISRDIGGTYELVSYKNEPVN